ncbi:MAG: hypothetical protein LQ338_004191 [Usnochroma carphineum]|nr:MAG: hypothetical protein LQ338_004191 [Usnochroma carphineum]
MAPPESEWMLWAKRLKDAIRTELDDELQALPTRFASLIQDNPQLDSLKEKIQDLTAGSEHTNQAVQTLQDRIREVESEASLRDQEFTGQSEKLHETARDLAGQLEHVVGAFEQFKREARVTAEEREQVAKQLREQIETLTTRTLAEQEARTTSKPLSEATAMDVSPNNGPDPPTSQPPQHNLKLSQGRATYEEYVNNGEDFVRAAVRQTEIRAVKAVVSGMRQAFRRKEIWKVLEEKGWMWAIARQELQKIVDEGKRRRANRRTINLPSLKEMDTSSQSLEGQ